MSLLGRVYTTGELGMMLLVAPRTVRKWIAAGQPHCRRQTASR